MQPGRMRLTAVDVFGVGQKLKFFWAVSHTRLTLGRNYLTEEPVVGTSVPQEREKENPGIFAVGGQEFMSGNATNQGLEPPASGFFYILWVL